MRVYGTEELAASLMGSVNIHAAVQNFGSVYSQLLFLHRPECYWREWWGRRRSWPEKRFAAHHSE